MIIHLKTDNISFNLFQQNCQTLRFFTMDSFRCNFVGARTFSERLSILQLSKKKTFFFAVTFLSFIIFALFWSEFSLFSTEFPFVANPLCCVLRLSALLKKTKLKDINLWTKPFLLSDWHQITERSTKFWEKERRNRLTSASSWRACPARMQVKQKTFSRFRLSLELFRLGIIEFLRKIGLGMAAWQRPSCWNAYQSIPCVPEKQKNFCAVDFRLSEKPSISRVFFSANNLSGKNASEQLNTIQNQTVWGAFEPERVFNNFRFWIALSTKLHRKSPRCSELFEPLHSAPQMKINMTVKGLEQ